MNLELLLEAERRGILPADKAALLEEARNRGLVPSQAPKPERTWREFFFGDDDPTNDTVGEKIATGLNKAGEALTFGLIGDEASAGLESLIPGVEYEDRLKHYRDTESQFEKDHPGAALTADVGGAVLGTALPVIGTAGRSAGMLRRALQSAGTAGRGAGVFRRVLQSAGTGATGAGVYGYMEGEGDDRLEEARKGATLGGAVGAVIPIAGAGVQRAADALVRGRAMKEVLKNAPSTDQQLRIGRQLYDQVEGAGVAIRPDATRRVLGEVTQGLHEQGAGYTGAEKVLPQSRAIMEAADDVGRGNTVPFRELDTFRRYVGNAAGANPANAADTRAATGAQVRINDFLENLGPNDVDAGDVKAFTTLWPKAKEIWARMSKSQMLDDAIDNAANYQSGEASGLRNQFRRIVSNPKLRRGFTDAEVKLMRRVVNGTISEQILNYMGSGLGMMGQIAAGGAAGALGGGPLGALAGTTAGSISAAGTRKLADRMTRRNAEIARALVAQGGNVNLPVATDSARRVAESLLRRGVAAVLQ